MAVQGVGRRYAEAVFDLATSEGTEERWQESLESLSSAARDDETRAYFENPAVEDEDKVSALEAILPDRAGEEPRNLTRLLIRRNRFDILPDIFDAFVELRLRAQGIAIADVTTAVEMTDPERQQVSAQLARIMGSQVEVRAHIDGRIVGGLVARIGDQLIDGSVRTQLRELRSSLARR
jgi:F-type H+-transporting ATPase subunit delta